MLAAGFKVTLDLGNVSFIDRPGLALLVSFSQRAGSTRALLALSRGTASIGIIATT